ncbi:hypothetical protein HDU96_003314, partial [Phlyctochytrium bullatum]
MVTSNAPSAAAAQYAIANGHHHHHHHASSRSASKYPLFGPYRLIRTIGEGEFGKVKLAVHSETNKE